MKKFIETMVVFFSFMTGVFHYMILTTFGLYHWITILMSIASFMIIIGGISMIGDNNNEVKETKEFFS